MFSVTVPVVSAILPNRSVNVEVSNARNWHQVVKAATRFAHDEEHIPAPVVTISERELMRRIRREVHELQIALVRRQSNQPGPKTSPRREPEPRFVYDER